MEAPGMGELKAKSIKEKKRERNFLSTSLVIALY